MMAATVTARSWKKQRKRADQDPVLSIDAPGNRLQSETNGFELARGSHSNGVFRDAGISSPDHKLKQYTVIHS